MPKIKSQSDVAEGSKQLDVTPVKANASGPHTSQRPEDITNISLREFLRVCFGQELPDNVHICSFSADPGTSSSKWRGERLGSRQAVSAQNNNYFCIGELKLGSSRKKENITAHHMIVVDDVGTKCDAKLIKARLGDEPTFIIETSPGNQTWGYVFSQPIALASNPKGAAAVDAIRLVMKDEGLGDKSTHDSTRYIRLPFGINGKAKYRQPDGTFPSSKLVHFDPTKKHRLEDIALSVLGSDWEVGARAPQRKTLQQSSSQSEYSAQLTDPLIILADEAGLCPRRGSGAGRIDAICPNDVAHTDQGGTGFAFLSDQTMMCHHTACIDLKSPDFKTLICERWEETNNRPAGAGRHRLANILFEQSPLTAEDEQIIKALHERALDESSKLDDKANGEGNKVSPHLKALQILLQNGAEIIRDPRQNVWLMLDHKMYDLGSPNDVLAVTAWIRKNCGLDIVAQAAANLKNTIIGEAQSLETTPVSFRQGETADIAAINLMNGKQEAVLIEPGNWKVVPIGSLPIRMANRGGALSLPAPTRANDNQGFFERGKEHLRLIDVTIPHDPTDKGVQQRAVILAFLLSQFIRRGSVPHLLCSSEQGSGKTTLMRRLKDLTDPDIADVVGTLPSSVAETFAIAARQSNIVVDNLSRIKNDMSDVLCTLSTGGAHQKRALYTDDDRAIFRAMTSVMLTTVIDDLAKQPDLLSRILPLPLATMGAGQRQSEDDLDANWEKIWGYLLADLLDLAAAALAGIANVMADRCLGTLPKLPRLADAACLAEAASRSIGWPSGLCISALNAVSESVVADRLSNDPVAQRVLHFVKSQPDEKWSGTTSDLLSDLHRMNILTQNDTLTNPNALPDISPTLTATGFSQVLDRLKAPMAEIWDLKFERKRSGGKRLLEIRIDPSGKGGGVMGSGTKAVRWHTKRHS